jgi:uncharacterized protein GlcG (DUF336 family)
MKTTLLTAALGLAAAPALAQDAFVEFRALTPELAQRAAVAAMEDCRAEGYQVGVTVTDRFGVPQVFVRDRFAGAHVHETSLRKAWTAVSFRTPTTELAEATKAGSDASGIRHLSQALPLGGGLMIVAGNGDVVAGIGVSGAPSPDLDDVCAEAGIAEIEMDIAF